MAVRFTTLSTGARYFALLTVLSLGEGKTPQSNRTVHEFPVVGLGVGNMHHEQIQGAVKEAVRDHGYRLIDTAAAARNEHLIAAALTELHAQGQLQNSVHVVTKVWYTHLGYERTLLSVRDSIAALGKHAVITVLLHWPRCHHDISWMRCEEEEMELPTHVRDAGPPPHQDPNAWKESWRAFEFLYAHGDVARIGVSNFDHAELKELTRIAKIKPHLHQGNVWSLAFDPWLVETLKEHNVGFQAYNVMNGILNKHNPEAQEIIRTVGKDLGGLNMAQCLLSWLVHQGVSVIPRASSSANIESNAPAAVSGKLLSPEQMTQVENAVKILLKSSDQVETPKTVSATFFNKLAVSVRLMWLNPQNSELVVASGEIATGGNAGIQTHPGHKFVAITATDKQLNDIYEITASAGSTQDFSIEDSRNEL